MQTTKSLLVIGECMMELSGEFTNGQDTYKRAFAGDTYNSAVYAKRYHPEMDVQILTAVGSDPISAAMLAQWDRDHIGHSLVRTATAAHPGIYAISTDESGERSFTYWRSASAATQLMSLLTSESRDAMASFDTLFFSGISLAILPNDDKAAFLSLLAGLKNQGCKIAFDPNYRPVLWDGVHHATHWLTEAYRLTDIALPGLEDHKEIFGHHHSEDVRTFLEDVGVGEIVVKADAEGIFGYLTGKAAEHLMVEHQSSPLDTTGAGDSFAGTYLAERIAGKPVAEALRSAAKIASLVVQHRGAIVPENIYRNFIEKDS